MPNHFKNLLFRRPRPGPGRGSGQRKPQKILTKKKGSAEDLVLRLVSLGSVQPSGRIHQSKAKSQRIAAWELLYRVQHLGRYVSRLQTILHSDIAVKIPRHEDDRRNTKHHCDGSFFRPSSESGSAAVNEDQVHGPNINRLP